MIREEIKRISSEIKKCEDKSALIDDYLSKIKKRTSDILLGTDKIVLIGATPFAKNVMYDRARLFPEKEVVLADEFDEIGKPDGGDGVHSLLKTEC